MLTALRKPESATTEPRTPVPRRPDWLTAERACLFALALCVIVAIFVNHWSEFTPDTKPDLYLNPAGLFQSSVSSWSPNPYQAGTPNFNTGLAPVAAVMWLIELPGIPPWVAVRLWRSML